MPILAGEDSSYRRFAHEAQGHWIGPCPIDDFSNLLPSLRGLRPCPIPPGDIFNDVPSNSSEKDMYLELVKALRPLELKGLEFVDMSAPHRKQKLDISAYTPGVRVGVVPSDPIYPGTKGEKEPSPMLLSQRLLSFELKGGTHDPFCDNPGNPDGLSRVSFRTHAFCVFMDSHIARLFRADRSGIIVSEAFNHRAHPQHLTNFLHNLDNATSNHRGVDITFDPDLRTVQVPIFSLSFDQVTVKLEGKLPSIESLIGRGRRAVKVVDAELGVSYFMKDGWRKNLLGAAQEWEVVDELHCHQVPHIPRIGGDISGMYHRTLADTFANSYWRVGPKTKLTPQVHYRFIEEDTGKPLEEFTDARELTQALADVVEALQAAWERCRCLHRDVSSTNITIDPDGRGTLIDWEFAKRVPEGGEHCERGHGRTGTWAYMSSAILKYPLKPHSPLDDLQSVYWVAFENGLNYLNHDYQYLSTSTRCLVEYDSMDGPHGGGGSYKGDHFLGSPRTEFLDNPTFSKLMPDFRTMMRSAELWERQFFKLGPDEAGSIPPDVPDHNRVLVIFRVALGSSEWALEQRNATPVLWNEANKYVTDVVTKSHSTTSQYG